MKQLIILVLFLTSCQSTFYVVRHAEKVDNSTNPLLSEDGKERAKDLTRKLVNKNISLIYSTDYLRTKNTAKPLADAMAISFPQSLPFRGL
jgi:2,3-bisphosphoglycerate-dependent phosphoglycerate mutase